MKIWLTTDWHLYNKPKDFPYYVKSLNYDKLMDKLHELVGPTDILICLGDLASRDNDHAIEGTADKELGFFGNDIRNLPGYKLLVRGNHDALRDFEYIKLGFDMVCTSAVYDNMIFTHKPIPIGEDEINIHGHVHNERYMSIDSRHIRIPPTEDSNDPPVLELDEALRMAAASKEYEYRGSPIVNADKEFCHKLDTSKSYLEKVFYLADAIDQAEMEYPVDEAANGTLSLSDKRKLAKQRNVPVFICLFHFSSVLSTLIATVTGDEYTHSAISFDTSLTDMYSFGKFYPNNPFIGRFVHESLFGPTYNQVTRHAIFAVFVTPEEKELMKAQLEWFIANKGKMRYNYEGLLKSLLHIPDDDKVTKYEYLCSEFVATILKYCGRDFITTPSNLVKPNDFQNYKWCYYLGSGKNRAYDQVAVDRRLAEIMAARNRGDEMYLESANGIVDESVQRFKNMKIKVTRTRPKWIESSDIEGCVDKANEVISEYNEKHDMTSEAKKMFTKVPKITDVMTDVVMDKLVPGGAIIRDAADLATANFYMWHADTFRLLFVTHGISIDPRKSTVDVYLMDGHPSNYFKKLHSWKVDVSVFKRIKTNITNEAAGTALDEILQLNKKLNKFKYSFGDKGEDGYRTAKPDQFERNGYGVCWDYVAYEVQRLKKISGVTVTAWYVVFISENGDRPNHVFVTIKCDGKILYFESSDKQHRGVYVANSEEDAVRYVAGNMNGSGECQVYRYNPLDSKLFGCNIEEFMDIVENQIGSRVNVSMKSVDLKKIEDNLNESVSLNENFIKNVPDLEWNLNTWDPNGKNFLWICGLSGGGKTTLANKMSEDTGAEVIHLDDLAQAAFVGSMQNPNFINQMSPTMAAYWKSTSNHIKMYKWGDQRLALETDQFVNWMIKNRESDGKLYIIEGCEIMYMDADYLIYQPLIIKGTSAMQTTFWRFKRTYGQHREKGESAFRSFEHSLKQFINIYKNGAMIAAENGLMRFKSILAAARKYNDAVAEEKNGEISETANGPDNSPEIRPDVKEIKDPYNSKDKAVTITFYDKDSNRIGEASISAINTRMPFLYDVEVFQKYRGKYYATSIMKYIMKEYNPKQLTVEPSNTIAINLYEKFGFYIYGNFQDGKTLMYEMRKGGSTKISEAAASIDRSPKLYHGSNKKLTMLNPRECGDEKPYVYASPDRAFAAAYAGEKWSDFEICQAREDSGRLAIIEMQPGMFRKKFHKNGYLYEIDPTDFKLLTEDEYGCEHSVTPIRVDEINVINELSSCGVKFYPYPKLPTYIPSRKEYFAGRAQVNYDYSKDKSVFKQAADAAKACGITLDEVYTGDAAELHAAMTNEEKIEAMKKYGLRIPGYSSDDDEDEKQKPKKKMKTKKPKNEESIMTPATDVNISDYNFEPKDIYGNRLHNETSSKAIIAGMYGIEIPTVPEVIEEAAKKDEDLYPVYVMLMHSGTDMANFIKFMTQAKFSHSSISFDASMNNMYTFGRKHEINQKIGTFKSENIHTDWFKERTIPYALYVVPVTKAELTNMKTRLDFFIKNESKFIYDFEGCIKTYFGISDNPEYRYFCSRFVADILHAGKPTTPKLTDPSLIKPMDFTDMPFAHYVTGGILNEYDEKQVRTITKQILREEQIRRKNELVEESVTDFKIDNPYRDAIYRYQTAGLDENALESIQKVLSSFKIRFGRDGSVVITRREYQNLRQHFNNSQKLMKASKKANNIEGMKAELAKTYYMSELITKYYMNNPKADPEVRKDMTSLRSVMINVIHGAIKDITKLDPEFDFQKYYAGTKYSDDIVLPKESLTAVGRALNTLII